MTITFKNGDLFTDTSEALVNTVNCVGVMGKGVALEFKKRWPQNYKIYKKLCDAKELRPGKLFIYENKDLLSTNEPKFLVNFPTKDHWRAKSKIEYISAGLDALVEAIKEYSINSIALPPLGCGNGGLDWETVKPLMVEKLSVLNDVDINIYGPHFSEDEPEHINSGLRMTYERAILIKAVGDLEKHFDGAIDRLSLQKIAYLLQALGLKLNIDFSKNLYGPYSDRLKIAFIALDKNKIISGYQNPERETHVTPSAYAEAEEFLKDKGEFLIEKLSSLIEGYESPYGLELLTTVHWLQSQITDRHLTSIKKAMEDLHSYRRNQYDQQEVEKAYNRLKIDQLI